MELDDLSGDRSTTGVNLGEMLKEDILSLTTRHEIREKVADSNGQTFSWLRIACFETAAKVRRSISPSKEYLSPDIIPYGSSQSLYARDLNICEWGCLGNESKGA
jgi:hypothetical protein